ncbi:DUF1206 domain-containing protein [Phytoactinopolyspora alkaliphila]|uniref:DUF1206 domain-containing protein n=2 Tax=Phytoactinopolyspora alkaliphila TaxID=1783498 RepID=A0A6N9YI29_9ACTN|nr:DUF1206 domain-containing protein [Phytoactinopolyspora alkaliphila]NED94607.1 DUF1206 domain-containing protein [Phytoactinopolyspora alkaliphila]
MISAKSAARRAARSDSLDRLARAGFVVYGLLHLQVGVLAFQLAWGGNGQADQSGAMAALADSEFGKAVLWISAVGFVALALWCVAELALNSRDSDGSRSLITTAKNAGKAVVFAALAFLALRFAVGGGAGGSGSGQQEENATQTLLGLPGGRLIVGALGLAIVAVGVYHVYKGLTRSFLDDLHANASDGVSGTAIVALGVVGFPAKGVAIALVGVLFIVAAVKHDSDDAGGLDEALKSLQEQPSGPWLLTIIAVGIAAFGFYCFGRAVYQK